MEKIRLSLNVYFNFKDKNLLNQTQARLNMKSNFRLTLRLVLSVENTKYNTVLGDIIIQ